MSKARKLRELDHPQVWLGTPRNGMVECVIMEDFGRGPMAARLWVPHKEGEEGEKVFERMTKRLKLDFSINLGHYSWLTGNTNPAEAYLANKG